MKTTSVVRAGLFVVFSACFGCAQSEPRGMSVARDVAAEDGLASCSFAFEAEGAQAKSRVERRPAMNGGEVLRGTTEVTLAGAAHTSVVTEQVELDAAGRLVRAVSELRSGPRGSELARSVELDAKAGVVAVRDAGGERAWTVETDHPWMYADLFTDIAPHAAGATAVQIWVARRAAQQGGRIRQVAVLAGRSSLTMSEQVVFHDGDRDLVIVGDEVAEADRHFVQALPWKAVQAISNELRASGTSCKPGPV